MVRHGPEYTYFEKESKMNGALVTLGFKRAQTVSGVSVALSPEQGVGRGGVGKIMGFGVRQNWAQTIASPFTSAMILDR